VNNVSFTDLDLTLIKDLQRNAQPFTSHPICLGLQGWSKALLSSGTTGLYKPVCTWEMRSQGRFCIKTVRLVDLLGFYSELKLCHGEVLVVITQLAMSFGKLY